MFFTRLLACEQALLLRDIVGNHGRAAHEKWREREARAWWGASSQAVYPSYRTAKTLPLPFPSHQGWVNGSRTLAFTCLHPWFGEKAVCFFNFTRLRTEGGVPQSFPTVRLQTVFFVRVKKSSILTFWPAFISPLHYNLLVRNLAKVIRRRKVGKTREKEEAQDDPFFRITSNGCFKHSTQS